MLRSSVTSCQLCTAQNIPTAVRNATCNAPRNIKVSFECSVIAASLTERASDATAERGQRGRTPRWSRRTTSRGDLLPRRVRSREANQRRPDERRDQEERGHEKGR